MRILQMPINKRTARIPALKFNSKGVQSFECTKGCVSAHLHFNLTQNIDNWRASVASETLTGVTQSKIGDVFLFIYLFVYMYGRMYVILCFDPRVFMLVMWSTPSQITLNRILWFIDQYPYHPRN